MQTYPYFIVKVFAQRHFDSNPLAVFPFALELYDTGEVVDSTHFYEIDHELQRLAIVYTCRHS